MRERLARGSSRTRPWWFSWVSDSALLTLSQGAVTLVGSLLIVILARTLSRADLGTFGALLGLSQALALITSFGITVWLLRELSALEVGRAPIGSSPSRATVRLVGGGVRVTLCLTLGVTVLGSCAGFLSGLSVSLALTLTALLIYTSLVSVAGLFEAVLRARREVKQVAIATGFEKLVLLLSIGVVLLTGAGLLAIGVCHIIAASLRVAYSFRKSRLYGTPMMGTSLPLREVTVASAPFALNSVATNLVPRLDVVVVAISSAVAASYFTIGERTIGVALLLPLIGTTTLYPFLASRRERGLAVRLTLALGLLGLVVGALGAATAPVVIPTLFGDKYAPAVLTIQLMFVAVPFSFATSALTTFLYTAGAERRLLLLLGPGSLVGTVGVALGAAVAGAPGAAVGLAGRQVLFLAGLLVLLFRMRTISPQGDHKGSAQPAPDEVVPGAIPPR